MLEVLVGLKPCVDVFVACKSQGLLLKCLPRPANVIESKLFLPAEAAPMSNLVELSWSRKGGLDLKVSLALDTAVAVGLKVEGQTLTTCARVWQGSEVTVEVLNYKRTGERFWNLLSMTPVRDTAGRVMSYIGVQSDISELVRRKEAEKELQEAKVRGPA